MAEWFEKRTLGNLLDVAVNLFGSREALCFENERWSFSEIRSHVDDLARGLIGAGVKPGDKVCLWMTNRPEWIYTFFAVAKIGAVLVPVNTRFRTSDMEYVLRQSDSSTLITMDESGPVNYLDMIEELCPEIVLSEPSPLSLSKFPELKRIIVLGNNHPSGVINWNELDRNMVSVDYYDEVQSSVDPDDIVLLMYTSGTTGFPKGVMHCHNIQRTLVDAASRMGMTSRDVILMYLPLFHCFGLYEGPIMSMVTGARMVLMASFDAKRTLELIEKESATVLNGFDTHFFDITAHSDCNTTDKSSLRVALLAAGMASSQPVAERTQANLCPTITAWGMTEVGVGATRSFLDSSGDDRCLASGHPLPGYEFKIIEPDTGLTQKFGTMGELCVRGYSVMQGYYKKSEETAAVIDEEGWLHTGDVGVMRDDLRVRFMGRYKDMLKVGGENVDPMEVEAFILSLPEINKVQIIGISHPRLSEVPCACVVLENGHSLELQVLDDFCRGQMASFKIPRHLIVMDEFPMTASGKVQKFRLRELAEQRLGNVL
ncbi:MAG: AMP-binding protein [Chloroflexota bacterium]|nr:AMP-binding protein [Chloroflexota bacterium]